MRSDALFLAQSDTTVGFLSQSPVAIQQAKQRDAKKPFLIEVESFKELQRFTRVPKSMRPFVRRANKTTFLYKKKLALRVVQEGEHWRFLHKFRWLYSSSANITEHAFNLQTASNLATILLYQESPFRENQPSKLYKIGVFRMYRIR